jgi:hypothetical protein
MKKLTIIAAACAAAWAVSASADWTDAACEIYPIGEDHTDVLIPCTFSQRTPGNFKDQDGRMVYRQSGLGDQGLIFRFPDESVYVYWNTKILEPADESSPTWPFTTDEYDATTLLRCKSGSDSDFGSCPAGVLRMENKQASIVVQNPSGEQFTINFMTDYVNAANRELEARLEGDTWILHFANGEVWEVPIAAIEGG